MTDYSKPDDLYGLVPPKPPSDRPDQASAGPGIDVVSLIARGVDRIREANRARQIRRIRERIDRELEGLTAARTP